MLGHSGTTDSQSSTPETRSSEGLLPDKHEASTACPASFKFVLLFSALHIQLYAYKNKTQAGTCQLLADDDDNNSNN
jgi:hypothetical protein